MKVLAKLGFAMFIHHQSSHQKSMEFTAAMTGPDLCQGPTSAQISALPPSAAHHDFQVVVFRQLRGGDGQSRGPVEVYTLREADEDGFLMEDTLPVVDHLGEGELYDGGGIGESRNRSFNSAEIGEIGEMMIHPVLRRFQHPRISQVLNWVESPETTKILGPQKKWSCVFLAPFEWDDTRTKTLADARDRWLSSRFPV